jgi:hypothetical protein
MTPMTLSKTRFTLAMECLRKLDYARDPRYHDARHNDDFLASLAEGGHQVGELARQMYPGGYLVDDRATDDQVRTTSKLLSQSEVTVFEGTIRHQNLLVRCDVLQKSGNQLSLIEVKAKGFDPGKDRFLAEKKGGHPVLSVWRPYLYDVAYQAYVLSLAYPDLVITPYLLLLDKTVTVSVAGLNTMLPVTTVGRKVTVTVAPELDAGALIPPVLRLVDVSQEVSLLHSHPIEEDIIPKTFEEFVQEVSDGLRDGQSFPMAVGAPCKKCQYYIDPAEMGDEHKSGWAECMAQHTHAPVTIPRGDTVFGLYRLGANQLTDLLNTQPLSLAQVAEAALEDKEPNQTAISLNRRRSLQWREHQVADDTPFILADALNQTLSRWRWPLHFIDFETSRPALPYHAQRTPYDQILFQFSHHVLTQDGRLEHRTQCLEATPGVPSSLPTLRALNAALAGDDGTVVHWWTHEATVLKDIRAQIHADQIPESAELITFIDSLIGAHGTKASGRLADLGMLVSKTVFYPGTGGSSSIKKILPAALRHSKALQARYGAEVYGTAVMPSLNFKDWQWVVSAQGKIRDPYELLDPVLSDPELARAVAAGEAGDDGDAGDFIANGGGALIAYDQLQQTGLAAVERARLTTQLLRYCELDTLAMVMVYQALTGHGV